MSGIRWLSTIRTDRSNDNNGFSPFIRKNSCLRQECVLSAKLGSTAQCKMAPEGAVWWVKKVRRLWKNRCHQGNGLGPEAQCYRLFR